ncbi:MAG: hypothetical protein EOO43_15660 [Flavobacterium sp.]|nr:MAG: hypothetical protein EOO43_15660 [Flavobacterium sp.]
MLRRILNSTRNNLLCELRSIEMMLNPESADRDTICLYRRLKYDAFRSRFLHRMGRPKEADRIKNNKIKEEANEFLKKFDEAYNYTYIEVDKSLRAYFKMY